jgi:RNA polymerase sigma-70 factor (ECF subfamily)
MQRAGVVPIYLDDRRLVKALLKGDERAFELFFNDNFARLYRFAAPRMGNDREAVRDVVQAALTRAVQKLRSYRGESALFTWLCAICRNEIADWGRRNARYFEHVVLSEDHPAIQAAVDSLSSSTTDEPLREYQKSELARLVQVALDHLPPRYGDALEWKYIQGHSVKEIAARLGISSEAAKSLLARARRAFEDIYQSLSTAVLDTAGGGQEPS